MRFNKFVAAGVFVASFAVAGASQADEKDHSYMGLGTGYTWTDTKVSGSDIDTDGAEIGVYGGRVWEMGKRSFVGLEGDVFNGDVDGSYDGLSVNQEWSFGAYGLAGYHVTEELKAYGKAGVVSTQFETNDAGTTDSEWLHGVRFGAGMEYDVSKNWALRGEYLYTNYQDENIAAFGGGFTNIEPDSHSVRVGMTYSF